MPEIILFTSPATYLPIYVWLCPALCLKKCLFDFSLLELICSISHVKTFLTIIFEQFFSDNLKGLPSVVDQTGSYRFQFLIPETK